MILFVLFCIIVVIMLGSIAANSRKRAPMLSKMCPFCRNYIAVKATVCEFCHSQIPPAQRQQPLLNKAFVAFQNRKKTWP